MDPNIALFMLIVLPIFITFISLPSWANWLRQHRFTTKNYRGETVITSAGPVLLVALIAVQPFVLVLEQNRVLWGSFFLFFLTMALLGLLDDLKGEKEVKGFRGHFFSAFQDKKITTGVIKATAGWGTGVFVSLLLMGSSGFAWLIQGTFLALSSNLFNLLDTRPGRSIKLFLFLSILLVLFERERSWFFIPAWSAIMGYQYWESSERTMLGDTGAYLLGSLISVYSLLVLPDYFLIIAVLSLGLIHVFAEKISINALLERPLQQILLYRSGKWGKE